MDHVMSRSQSIHFDPRGNRKRTPSVWCQLWRSQEPLTGHQLPSSFCSSPHMNIMYKILSDYQDECHVQQSHVDKSTMTSFVHMYASKEAPYVAWISNLYQVLVTFYTWILCTRFKRWMSFATELCWWCNHGKFHIRKNIEHTIA